MMYLQARCDPGDSIEEAAESACRMAKTLDVAIEFQFNGESLRVWHFNTPDQVIEDYHAKTRNSVAHDRAMADHRRWRNRLHRWLRLDRD